MPFLKIGSNNCSACELLKQKLEADRQFLFKDCPTLVNLVLRKIKIQHFGADFIFRTEQDEQAEVINRLYEEKKYPKFIASLKEIVKNAKELDCSSVVEGLYYEEILETLEKISNV